MRTSSKPHSSPSSRPPLLRPNRTSQHTPSTSDSLPPHPTVTTNSTPPITTCPQNNSFTPARHKSSLSSFNPTNQPSADTNLVSSKSPSSRSFPNLSRFVHHRERRASDITHQHHRQQFPNQRSLSSNPNIPHHSTRLSLNSNHRPASINSPSSVSHHHSRTRPSRSNPRRTFLSPSRSVSLDFIPRRRKPSNHHPNHHLQQHQQQQLLLQPLQHCAQTHLSNEPTIPSSTLSSSHVSPSSIATRPGLDDSTLRRATTEPSKSTNSGTDSSPISSVQTSSTHNTHMSQIDHNQNDTNNDNELSSTSLARHSTGSVVSHSPSPHPSTQDNPSQKRLARSIGSGSHNIRRLSLGHRGHCRNVRSTSFGDVPRNMWASGSLFMQRLSTDQTPSRSTRFTRSRGATTDLRTVLWKKASCSCADFAPMVEQQLVEIGKRLPDRTERIAGEDVFGRRRGDFIVKGESMTQARRQAVLACQDQIVAVESKRSRHVQIQQQQREKEKLKQLSAQKAAQTSASQHVDDSTTNDINVSVPDNTQNGSQIHGTDTPLKKSVRTLSDLEGTEEELTMKNIAKAMESSKGRLRKSANMSNAFRAVIRSGDGFVRKSDVVQARLNSGECKDASMIILLEPDCFDGVSRPGGVEGVSSASEESGSGETVGVDSKVSGMMANVGFSTSMTAKQCAATLETISREMSCKVSRHFAGDEDGQYVIRLRVSRCSVDGCRTLERKIRVQIIIREVDRIRTTVSFRRQNGIYVSRESHVPLCTEIRDRFQREWPAVVEALYIRIPAVPVTAKS